MLRFLNFALLFGFSSTGCGLVAKRIELEQVPVHFVAEGNGLYPVALMKLIQAGAWDRALPLVEKIASQEELVSLDESSNPAQLELPVFVDPGTFLIRALGGAPRRFLNSYRDRFDRQAQRVSSGDWTLARWRHLFFCTGMDAEGNALANRLYDEGKSKQAFEVWRQIYDYFPDPCIPREVLAGRMMLAAAASGDREALNLVPNFPGSTVAGRWNCPLIDIRRNLMGMLQENGPPARDLRILVIKGSGVLAPGLRSEVLTTPSGWKLCLTRGTSRVALIHVLSCNLSLGVEPDAPAARIDFKKVREMITMAFVLESQRLLWACPGGMSGVVDLDSLSQSWLGPLPKAPVPPAWKELAAAAFGPRTTPEVTELEFELENFGQIRFHGPPTRPRFVVRIRPGSSPEAE
jgi:hypothetical protein